MKDVVKSTEMNVLGSTTKGEFTKFSDNFYKLFENRTGLSKSDLQFCEIQLYPAYPARFVGLDKSMIGGSGQDDGICCYTAVKALLSQKETPKKSVIVSLVSYEETGSQGCVGAQSN